MRETIILLPQKCICNMAPLRGIGDTKIFLRFEKLCFLEKKNIFPGFFLDLEKVKLGLQVTQLCEKSVLGACVIRVNIFFPRKYFSAKRENTFWLKIETGGKAGLIRPSGETNSLNNE